MRGSNTDPLQFAPEEESSTFGSTWHLEIELLGGQMPVSESHLRVGRVHRTKLTVGGAEADCQNNPRVVEAIEGSAAELGPSVLAAEAALRGGSIENAEPHDLEGPMCDAVFGWPNPSGNHGHAG